ncbi:PQQ-binding-like beta-propeller repeat protein [Nocardioides sp. NPDC051685]|uniref:outer membrane protein assembly factor BamB family protein n=1 Tax=Nocardioides sp. NPDC051685 TaxID=3364334 RepID=UPI0037B40BE9
MKIRLGIIAIALTLSACGLSTTPSSAPSKSPSTAQSSVPPTLEPGESPYYQPLWTLNDLGFKIDVSTQFEIVGDTALIRTGLLPEAAEEHAPERMDPDEYADSEWLAAVDIPSRKVIWEMPVDRFFAVRELTKYQAIVDTSDPALYAADGKVVVGFRGSSNATSARLTGVASIDPSTLTVRWAKPYKQVVDREDITVERQFVGAHDRLIIQTIEEYTGNTMDGEPKRTHFRTTQAFDASTGEVAWERKNLFAISVSNGVVLARTLPDDATAEDGSPFAAVDATTGKTMWQTKWRTNLFGISKDWVMFDRDDIDPKKIDPNKGVYALETGAKKVGFNKREHPALPAGGRINTDRIFPAGDGVVWDVNGRGQDKIGWLADGADAPVRQNYDAATHLLSPVVANDHVLAYDFFDPWTFLDDTSNPVGEPLPFETRDNEVGLAGSYLFTTPKDTDTFDATITLYRLIQ